MPRRSRRRRLYGLALIILVLLVVIGMALRGVPLGQAEREPEAPLSVTAALSGEAEAEGFERVSGPEPLVFPDDHGPHPGYRHEWWYVTGNVATDEGRHFGFQVTLFRFNVAPDHRRRDSVFATNQLWMGHMAITDTEGGAFHHRERFARGAADLAGGTAQPFRVWLEDWELAGVEEDAMPMQVRFHDRDLGIELRLEPRKPLSLQGDRGYSQKGPKPGNASRYYSWTRLDATGELQVAGESHAVAGSAWMDREWGTSTLAEEQVGWDWFSLQLDDGRDLMMYHLRRDDGSVDPHSKGLLVEADGASRVLARDDVELEAQRHWESPHGGRYPVAWRLRLPDEELDLELQAVLDDQELTGAFRYWEGAIRARGRDGPDGRGYAELTGY